MKSKILWVLKSNGNWSNVTKFHLIDELTKSGNTIEIIYLKDNLDEFNINLQQIYKKNKNSILISQYNQKSIYIETITLAKKYGIKTLLVASDTLVDSYYYRKICRYYDLVWIFDNSSSNLFNKWGANTISLPFAANKYLSRIPKMNKDFSPKVLFYGNPYGSRISQINQLLNNNIPVDIIYGFNEDYTTSNSIKGFKRYFGQINTVSQMLRSRTGIKILLGKLISLFRNEKLNRSSPYLNIYDSLNYLELYNKIYEYKLTLTPGIVRNTGFLNNPIYVINLRHFETPSAGGIMLVDSEELVKNYYRNKIDYLVLPSDGDFTLIKEFLSKDDKSIKNIKSKIIDYTTSNHSWTKRFMSIIESIESLENKSK